MSIKYITRTCPRCGNPDYVISLDGISDLYKYKCINCNSYLTDEDFISKQEQTDNDMVRVVRCKYCKYGSIYMTEDVCGKTLIECNHPELGDTIAIHAWDWFCADAERK